MPASLVSVGQRTVVPTARMKGRWIQKRFERLAEIELGLVGERIDESSKGEATLFHVWKEFLMPAFNIARKTGYPDFFALQCSAKRFDRPKVRFRVRFTGWKYFFGQCRRKEGGVAVQTPQHQFADAAGNVTLVVQLLVVFDLPGQLTGAFAPIRPRSLLQQVLGMGDLVRGQQIGQVQKHGGGWQVRALA